jgi:hypothetical protein
MMAGYPKIQYAEEGMRDGLQIENADIPVHGKIRLIGIIADLRNVIVSALLSIS